MKQFLSTYKFHITVGTAIAIISFLLSFGISAGSYKNELFVLQRQVFEHDQQIKKIPVIESNIVNINSNIRDIKDSIKELRDILLKRN